MLSGSPSACAEVGHSAPVGLLRVSLAAIVMLLDALAASNLKACDTIRRITWVGRPPRHPNRLAIDLASSFSCGGNTPHPRLFPGLSP